MRNKLTIGVIILVVGIFLNELSCIVDMLIVRILLRTLSTAIWTVGLVISARAIDYIIKQKRDK